MTGGIDDLGALRSRLPKRRAHDAIRRTRELL
jgi:hypothetical protein